MPKIKIIHIDDELQTLQFCESVFSKIDKIEYVAGFNNATDAVKFLENEKVDLIFCDIEMPLYNGLWLAENLPYTIPIVFVTAHSGFAVEAFEACALHYLVKPLTVAQLNNVIERFNNSAFQSNLYREQINQFYNNYLPQNITQPPSRIYINNIGKIIIINLGELMYLEGAGNYTKFYTQNLDVHTSSKNLKVYDDAIAHHASFIRIHRSYIINKNFVKQIIKSNSQQWLVEMKNQEKFEISKGRLDEILEQLQS